MQADSLPAETYSAMLTAVLLYVTSPVLTYLRTQSLRPLATFLQFFLYLIPSSDHRFDLFLYELGIWGLYVIFVLDSSCEIMQHLSFLSGSFHLVRLLKFHPCCLTEWSSSFVMDE